MAYKISPELEALLEKLVGKEKDRFFDSIGQTLPHTIRFNTLKGEVEELKKLLEQQGFNIEPVPGFENIFRLVYQPYPIGKSLSHFLGHFYVQDLASMLPPLVLDCQPGETVLDMAAAPGSKTTQLAVMMQNKGVIIANDIVLTRLRTLINNLQRFGILNTAVVKNFAQRFGNQYFETFDRILLDPACSGLGTLHKNPEVLSWWTPKHCIRLASTQQHMIISAIKALKPGGVLVYSTCTLTPEENEEIIDFALSNYPVETVPFNLPGLEARPGLTEFNGKKYHPQLEMSKRLYPFEMGTEGFFIAMLQKTESTKKPDEKRERKPVSLQFVPYTKSPVKKYLDYFSNHFEIDRKMFSTYFYFMDKSITAASKKLAEFQFKSKPLKSGLLIGRPMSQAGKFTTEGTHLFGKYANGNVYELPDFISLEQFVNRKALCVTENTHGQVIVKINELPIGYGLSDGTKLKSQFPKADWPFELTLKED